MPDYISDAEKLARAVILYFRGSPWTKDDSEQWEILTGKTEANTRVLCDFARRVMINEEERSYEKETPQQ